MADRLYVFDGSPTWSVDYALGFVVEHNIASADVAQAAASLAVAMKPADRPWVIDRLTVLSVLFSIGRNASSPNDLAVWLAEGARLLADVPHDILAVAIDQAIVTRTHGFMPSVGEIRTIADPMSEARRTQILRLEQMQCALGASVQ